MPMLRYRVEEVKPEEIGQAQAVMLVSLWDALLKGGIEREMAEKLAVTAAGAASCNSDGCHGALARVPMGDILLR